MGIKSTWQLTSAPPISWCLFPFPIEKCISNDLPDGCENDGESVQKQQCKKTTISKHYYLGLWKLEGTRLYNRNGVPLTGNWIIPSVGTAGPIINVTNANNIVYLSTNGKTAAGSVVVEEAVDTNDDDQKWERSASDDSGFFNLKNPNSGLFLIRTTALDLTIGNP